MPVHHIATPHDPRLAWYRGVADPELLRRGGRFIAEGRTVVARLLTDTRWNVESVLLSPAAHAALAPALDGRAPDLTVFVADLPVLAVIAGYNIHRGCLAIGMRPAAMPASSLMRARADDAVWLGLDRLNNADNVGSCFRNAAAFGVGAVLLDRRCADPLYRKAIRTSMAGTLLVPYARANEWDEVAAACRHAGRLVVGLDPSERAVDLGAAQFPHRRGRPLLVLAGSEGAGLSAAARAICDTLVRIPMSAGVDSLNVATALGIVLYVLTQRRT